MLVYLGRIHTVFNSIASYFLCATPMEKFIRENTILKRENRKKPIFSSKRKLMDSLRNEQVSFELCTYIYRKV